MIPDPLDWLHPALRDLESRGLRRRLKVRTPVAGAVDRRDDLPTQLINFASNDYLGLASDVELAERTQAILSSTLAIGSGASPVVSGRTELHARLEDAIARWLDTEAALVFSSGFAAGVGVVPSLVDRDDAIFSDELNHACLIDGCRLSHAERFIYRHNDIEHLARQISSSTARRKLIVTDSLFSMGGDFAPLRELGDIAEQHSAMLLVDEAHSTAVFGSTGAGLVEQSAAEAPRLKQQATIRMGTLSKALGAAGGFVAGSQQLIDWLANRARSYVFSTAPALPVVAAALAAIEISTEQPHRRERLLTIASHVRQSLQRHGWDIADSSSQIIPVVVGDPNRAMQFSTELAEQGLWVSGIRPPTVPEGRSQLRISLRSDHTDQQIEQLLTALARSQP